MGDDGGGSFAAAPPPVSGLGNFKGVMLCNRPADDSVSKLPGGGEGPPPFRSAVGSTGEQLGLPPCKKHHIVEGEVKKRGPSAALRRHVRWLKELQAQMHAERDEVEEDEKQAAERKERMKAVFEQQRDAVRKMMQERDAEHAAKEEKSKASLQRPSPEPQAEKQEKPKAAKKKSKPLWALTEQEKEEFEENEADDLLNFADNLNYDKYMGDLEFKTGLAALRDHAGRLQKEQDAFKDALVNDFNVLAGLDEEGSTSAGSPRSSKLEDGLEGMSILGDLRAESVASGKRSVGAERYNADGRPEWDASTNAGDDVGRVNREAQDAATQVLESAPQMRQIHSKESIAKVIEKARERPPPEPKDLIQMMADDDGVPAPVITQSADTQIRLNKDVDPSQLPYLYRSPAI